MMQENGISLFYAKSSRHRRIAAFILWVGKQNFFFHSLRSHVAQGKETEKEKKQQPRKVPPWEFLLGEVLMGGVPCTENGRFRCPGLCSETVQPGGILCSQVGLGLTK